VSPESPQDQEKLQNPEFPGSRSAPSGPDSEATPGAEPREISYDKLIKTGLRAHYGDVVEWLVKERPLEVKTLEPVQATTVERLVEESAVAPTLEVFIALLPSGP
jgi:hypothetical protein